MQMLGVRAVTNTNTALPGSSTQNKHEHTRAHVQHTQTQKTVLSLVPLGRAYRQWSLHWLGAWQVEDGTKASLTNMYQFPLKSASTDAALEGNNMLNTQQDPIQPCTYALATQTQTDAHTHTHSLTNRMIKFRKYLPFTYTHTHTHLTYDQVQEVFSLHLHIRRPKQRRNAS
jgi:hypothetical protein